jgi:signal transduction histidine kinase
MLEEGRTTDESERREYLGVISRETERLSGLIQRVHDLARFEGRKGHALRPRPVDVAGFISDTADVFRRRLTPGEAEVTVEVPDDLPDHAIDPEALREVLLNLLSNALKYGGKVIRLAASSENGTLVIEVADDGIGIAEHEQGKIFEKFYRAEDHLAREVEGSGLGLALVREVARAHGGGVTVTSRPGEGSRFVVELPG